MAGAAGQAVPEKIPWDDPAFSARMLREHLDQRHGAASRPFETIDLHCAWIASDVLGETPGRVLDLGCGPGLYTARLAGRGHSCTGIDISPASVEYAKTTATADGLDCTYLLGDVRSVDLGGPYDLAMMIFGEINVFSRADAGALLTRVCAALAPGGRLIVELHTAEAVAAEGRAPASWFSSRGGLYSPVPHLVLSESGWDQASAETWARHYVIDAATGSVALYGERISAYEQAEFSAMLGTAGFGGVQYRSDFGGVSDDAFVVVTATRLAAGAG